MRKAKPPSPHLPKILRAATCGTQSGADYIDLWRPDYRLKLTHSSSTVQRQTKTAKGLNSRLKSFFNSKNSTCSSVITAAPTLENGAGSNLVREYDYKSEASKVAQAISNPGRFLSFLAWEQSQHLGNLELCQHPASAACRGMGEEGRNIWAAGFHHKAFSLRRLIMNFLDMI
jgi:hypothetical protein